MYSKNLIYKEIHGPCIACSLVSPLLTMMLSSFCEPGIVNVISFNPLNGLMKLALFSFLLMEGEALRNYEGHAKSCSQ